MYQHVHPGSQWGTPRWKDDGRRMDSMASSRNDGNVTARARAADRLPERVIRECARAQAPLLLLERVATLVRGAIPYAVAGWLLVDPDTMLINGVHAESVTRSSIWR